MKQKQGTKSRESRIYTVQLHHLFSGSPARHSPAVRGSESAISRTRTAKQRRPRRRSSGLCWEASRPAWPVISIYLASERSSGGGRKRKEIPQPCCHELACFSSHSPHVWGPLLTPYLCIRVGMPNKSKLLLRPTTSSCMCAKDASM